MADRRARLSTAFVSGFGLGIMAVICNIVAFSVDHWLFTPPMESTVGLERAGLWRFCVQSLMDERNRPSIKGIFYGCHWIFDTYYDPIRWIILNPVWFVSIQIMAIVSLILSCIAGITLTARYFNPQKYGAFIIGTLCMMFVGIFGFLEALVFGIYAKDRQFYEITNIQTKQFGAGWYLSILSAFSATASTFALVASLVSVRRERRKNKKAAQTLRLAEGRHAPPARSAMKGSLSEC